MKKICRNCILLLESKECNKHGITPKEDQEMGCFDAGDDRSYKSREYCRSVECEVQVVLDSDASKEEKEEVKVYCHKVCDAYDFHKWLKENDYIIRRKK